MLDDHAAGILVSLKPEFAQAIASGAKSVELRRRFPQASAGAWLVIYVTNPIQALVGMARIMRVDQAPPSTLWRRHAASVGIGKSRFDQYFLGCKNGYAVVLDRFVPVKPILGRDMDRISTGLRPPQSFRYLTAESLRRIVSPVASLSTSPAYPSTVER